METQTSQGKQAGILQLDWYDWDAINKTQNLYIGWSNLQNSAKQ